jgi:hypothetical protein
MTSCIGFFQSNDLAASVFQFLSNDDRQKVADISEHFQQVVNVDTLRLDAQDLDHLPDSFLKKEWEKQKARFETAIAFRQLSIPYLAKRTLLQAKEVVEEDAHILGHYPSIDLFDIDTINATYDANIKEQEERLIDFLKSKGMNDPGLPANAMDYLNAWFDSPVFSLSDAGKILGMALQFRRPDCVNALRGRIERQLIQKLVVAGAPTPALPARAVDYLNAGWLSNLDLGNFANLLNVFATTGHLACLKALIRSPRINDIPPFVLGGALIHAVENGHLESLNALIRSPRFKDISPDVLGWALRWAVQHGHIGCLNALICSPRINDIPPDALRGALIQAG